MRVCGPTSIEVAAYSRCLAQMSEDYGKYLEPGLPRPFYMPHPVPLYRQTLKILENVLGPNDAEVNDVAVLCQEVHQKNAMASLCGKYRTYILAEL